MITEADVYQTEALKTLKTDLGDKKLLYLTGKLAEEAAEVLGPCFKHAIHGKPIDSEHIKKELGDVCFYLAAIANHFDLKLSEVMTANIEKLRARHGESYNHTYYIT